MSYSDPYTSSCFDDDLAANAALTWVPWVGSAYSKLPAGRKVLIVAESHYSNEQKADEVPRKIEELMQDKSYTRAVVSESLVHNEWSTRTLSTMHQLLFSPKDREAFWSHVAFFNIVQRPMWFRDGAPERPTWEDYWKGWRAFLAVVQVLKPDHVLFIGVEAANHFNGVMAAEQHEHVAVEWIEKVGSAYARTASLVMEGTRIPIHFIKHCGKYFSTDRWSDYLHRNATEMMRSLALSAGASLPDAPARSLHVLGMAKSCLDLRGANAPKLELDFLRLVMAIRDFEDVGDEAVGYLLVLNEKVAARAKEWQKKYGIGDKVIVRVASISEDDLATLRSEKLRNAAGMLQLQRIDDAEALLSLADDGKRLGETHLATEITKDYPGILPLQDTKSREALPLHIAWDYYGTIPLSTPKDQES